MWSSASILLRRHHRRPLNKVPKVCNIVGGVVSPILSNIYLDKLDAFVEQTLLPKYNREEIRRRNPQYRIIYKRMERKKKAGKLQEARALEKQLRALPVGDPADPSYRRLRYIRYADDTLFGFAGPKAEAEDIKRQLKEFLQASLKLQLSEEKTLITHCAGYVVYPFQNR